MIEKPNSFTRKPSIEVRIPHLFIFLAVFSALVAVLYGRADDLYQASLKQTQALEEELMQSRQENAELEFRITDLLEKLTRLNKLYSASLRKTANRVQTIESGTSNTARKAFEVQSTNNYLIQQNRNLVEQLQVCQKARMSSSCIETDPLNPAIVRETIR